MPPVLRPESLQKGDSIGIVSTARKISKEELQHAVSVLESWGLKVVFGKNLFAEHHQFAGTDEQRRSDFQHFMDDENIRVILCARGGYGTVRIIDDLDFTEFLKKPKWVCGYSDVTVLHSKLATLGVESLHCSMPVNFEKNTQESLESLRKALFGEPLFYEVGNHKSNKKGETEAEIIGGNLSMIYSQTGSETAVKTDGKILFLEDLDEYLYHIDRMMQNLQRNHLFKNAKGIIIGSMTDMNDNTIPFGKNAEEILSEYFKDLNIPICFGFPAGHLNDNRALIFGRKARLKVAEKTMLKFL